MVFNCILCYLHPKIVIFQEPLETNVIGFGMPQTLNMCHSSHFDTFFPVKINKMLNFCLKLLNFFMTKNEKKPTLKTEALWFGKAQTLICATHSHFGYAFFTMYYVINFVWQILFELMMAFLPFDRKCIGFWNPLICTGRMWMQGGLAYVPIQVWWFLTNCNTTMSPKILIFQEVLIIETWNKFFIGFVTWLEL